MSMPGVWEMLVILVVVMLLFGGKRIPQLGSALGEGIRNFKKALHGDDHQDNKASEKSKTNE